MDVSLRRRYLLSYVNDVQPSVMDSFSNQASPEVLDAMRHTVTNLVGSLPPQVRGVRCWALGVSVPYPPSRSALRSLRPDPARPPRSGSPSRFRRSAKTWRNCCSARS